MLRSSGSFYIQNDNSSATDSDNDDIETVILESARRRRRAQCNSLIQSVFCCI